MSREVLFDVFLSVNAVDLSDHVFSLDCPYGPDLVEALSMGDVAKRRLASLIDYSVTAVFHQDFAASSVYATLKERAGIETAIAWRKSKTDAISAINPELQGNYLNEPFPLISGGVGELSDITITWQVSDGADLVVDVTP